MQTSRPHGTRGVNAQLLARSVAQLCCCEDDRQQRGESRQATHHMPHQTNNSRCGFLSMCWACKPRATFRMIPGTHGADLFPCAGRAILKTTRDVRSKCPTAFVVAKMTGSSDAKVAKRQSTFRMKPTTHAADFFPCAGRANLKTSRDARSKCLNGLLLRR